jgi:integrase
MGGSLVICAGDWRADVGDRRGAPAKEKPQGLASPPLHRSAAAGLDPATYSGHSLRAGLATSAAQAGVPTWRISAQTRHASDAMLARYIRDGELFTENAAGAFL